MKTLLIVNLVFAGLFVICFWIFAFFTNGAFVNPVGLVIAGFLGWCVLTPAFPCAPALFVFNIYGVFKYWSKYKLMALLPLLVFGIAVMSLFVWDVRAISIRRFEKYLPDYEAFVAKVEKKHKPGDLNSIDIPKEYRHLGYSAIVDYDEPNNLYVIVLVGSRGVFGHTYFLHSSNGDIAPGFKVCRIVHYKERVNEHWFRISD
jgi:hypothetical protein